jgi:hypothetical protein
MSSAGRNTATTPKVAGCGRHAKDGGSGVRRIGNNDERVFPRADFQPMHLAGGRPVAARAVLAAD